jgi:NAD(P)-dependent dehydrogenase (short-subunit alcohol dehydrogenase family)
MICAGRVVIVTGAGRGIGRAHALAFAAAGARVVVNDIGVSLRGDGTSEDPAGDVVAAIHASGGEAVASHHDISSWDGAAALVALAVDTFGGLDVVVNNAGIVRDRMFVNSEPAEWEATLRVHVLGHAFVARHAAAWWRDAKKAGRAVDARIINTSSGAGLQGSVGQAAYSAAKAAIAALTLVQAAELARYGVTANAIAPAARTRMTETVFADAMRAPEDGFDPMDPANVSPVVVWLGSAASRAVTGRMFEVQGGRITLFDGWSPGGTADAGRTWAPEELGPVIADLLANATAAAPVYGAS